MPSANYAFTPKNIRFLFFPYTFKIRIFEVIRKEGGSPQIKKGYFKDEFPFTL
jgi:hypothetical protein